jgi:hypothetical protein
VRAVLVGESNPYGPDEGYALYPEPERSAGERLCRNIMGLTPRTYLASFLRVNLCDGPWRIRAARQRASMLLMANADCTFVALGAKVCSAFGIPFAPFTLRGNLFADPSKPRFVILPHPSGLSRLWDGPQAYDRARATLRAGSVLPVPEVLP